MYDVDYVYLGCMEMETETETDTQKPVFLKPDRKLNRKYFGSRFNMVRPGQTWFNNMV